MIQLPLTVKISIRALRVNKVRSALTMLGIVIGVSAVIVMLAVGSGARQKIGKHISGVGSHLLIILPGSQTAGREGTGPGAQPMLTLGDLEALFKGCPAVLDAAPVLNGVTQIVYGDKNWSTGVVGTTPNMLQVRDWPLASGKPFTSEDVKKAGKVCLLGHTVAGSLFGSIDPVGQSVRIKNIPFKVIGVLARKGQTPITQDQDDTIFVPITTAQKKLVGATFQGMVRMIMVKAKNTEYPDDAEKQITELLKQRHHLGPKQDNDFTIRNLTRIVQAGKQFTNVVTMLLGAIASISLLVGGIGIMNIMLVSVTERTREIGIRMAVGAKAWHIRLQFLIEALILSLIGGTVGIIVGISCSEVLSRFVGWDTVVSPLSILLAINSSVAVGIFFGFYPAYKASHLNPIDALRYE